jgi:hypothetical protein
MKPPISDDEIRVRACRIQALIELKRAGGRITAYAVGQAIGSHAKRHARIRQMLLESITDQLVEERLRLSPPPAAEPTPRIAAPDRPPLGIGRKPRRAAALDLFA